MVAQAGQRVTALLYCHHHSSSCAAQDVLVTLPKKSLISDQTANALSRCYAFGFMFDVFVHLLFSVPYPERGLQIIYNFFFTCHSLQTNREAAYNSERLCTSRVIICIFAGWTKGISHQRGVSIKKWYLNTKGYQDDIMLLRRVWLTHWGLWPSEVN